MGGVRLFRRSHLFALLLGIVVTQPPSGTDQRTAVDAATGAPNLPYTAGDFQVLSGMAGTDGVIRVANKYINGSVILNAGSTPIEIRNCVILHGPNQAGVSGGGGTNLTMYDVGIYGSSPTLDGNARERSVYLYRPTYVDIHHVTMEAAGGIKVDGQNGVQIQKVHITNLRSRNVIGSSSDFRHCVQLANVMGPDIVVNYVESYNEPDKSRTEDTINLYNAGGTDLSHKLNGKGFYLKGSYPYGALETYFSGAALSADGSGDPNEIHSQYIALQDAWLVSNCGAAANIATGHDISYTNLHAVSSGYLPDGRVTASNYRGFWIGDFYGLGAGANNTMGGITVRYMRTKDLSGGTRRADFIADPNVSSDVPNPGIDVANAILLPDTTTRAQDKAQEDALFIQWRDYLNTAGQTCGSRFVPS